MDTTTVIHTDGPKSPVQLDLRSGAIAWPNRVGWVLVALALSSAVFVGAFTAVAAKRIDSPQFALSIDPNDAGANGRLAQLMLERSEPPAMVVQIATRALLRDPTIVEAARSLGIAQALQQQGRYAERSMDYAASLSRRDLGTTLWLIERHVASNDVNGALRLYDTALRTSGGAHKILFPILASTLNDPEFVPPVAKLLSAEPVWKRNFLEFLMNGKASPADTAGLINAIASSGGRVDADISRELINRLVIARDFNTAWGVYGKLFPAQIANRSAVRNKNITASGSGTAFDWQYAQTGETAFQPAVNGTPASFTSFASAPVAIAYQLLLLRPGHYQLTSRASVEHSNANADWTLNCAGSDREIGRASLTEQVASDFAVVTADCPAQWLRLVVSSHGQDVVEGKIYSVETIGRVAADTLTRRPSDQFAR